MTTLLIVGDLHVNSTVAICTPTVNLDDAGEYHQSPGQAWLWGHWQTLLSIAVRVPDLVTIFNGDLCEGDTKDRSHQMISRNEATIQRMTTDLIEPLVRMSRAAYIIRGTEAHTGKSGALEEAIANDLDLPGPSAGVHSWYTLPLSISGVRLDIAHSMSGGGGMPWTRRNAANGLASRTVMEYACRGEKPPNYVVRSHIHRAGDSHDAYPCRALITPCWTLATSYVTKLAPSSLADVGAIFIHIERKQVFLFNPKPPRTQWTNIPCSPN
jgi:hypothetical protein